MRAFAVAPLFLCGLVLPATAASFDCGKASTALEKQVCADPALSKADEEMAVAYARALTVGGSALREDQREWLKTLSTGPSDQLLATYQARIGYLKNVAILQSSVTPVSQVFLGATCLPLPAADGSPPAVDYDKHCEVQDVGPVGGADDLGLVYQMQSYWMNGGTPDALHGLRTDLVVVLKPIPGKPNLFLPIVSAGPDEVPILRSPPKMVKTPSGLRLLYLPGNQVGTANFSADGAYILRHGRFDAVDLDQDTLSGTVPFSLPEGLQIRMDVYPDFQTMTATVALWKIDDGDCCPSGGDAVIKLALVGNRLVATGVRVHLAKRTADKKPADPDP